MPARVALRLGALALFVAAPACQTTQAGGPALAVAPGAWSHGYPPGEGRDGVEDFGALERTLATYRRDHAALLAAATAKRDAETCEEMFALMHSICEVKEKLCGLADAHAGAPGYSNLCAEAREECVEAQTSCEVCTEPSDTPAEP
ncbi:MAG: hypothetical protein AAF721_11455 [Myxococcota bacterium]